jgi:hypothetical protein
MILPAYLSVHNGIRVDTPLVLNSTVIIFFLLEPLQKSLQSQQVSPRPKAADLATYYRGNDRVSAKFFTGIYIGKMHLYCGDANPCQRIPQSYTVISISPGINDDPNRVGAG